jgi:flagellar assembly factor FliW
MDKQRQTINSRIGPLVVSADKTIRFPRGLIGFESLRDFALVEFKPGTPFHFLQSIVPCHTR